ALIQQWIQDDRSGFLVEAVENQGTSLLEISQALERHEDMGIEDKDLSRAIQVGLRVSLVRRFLTDELDYINVARSYVEVRDFYDLVRRVIAPPRSYGKLGGKGAGLFLATRILRGSPEVARELGTIRSPKTWYITSDGVLDFIQYNSLEDIYNWKYLEIEQVRDEYPHIVQVFKNSHFSPEIVKGLSLALDDLEEKPLIVRSSSLLEDRLGSSFSGKYKSLFLANQGTKRERLLALLDAISEVYASIFGPDPIEYRAERGLLDVHEEMGILIQEVVGTRVGKYFFPSFAGVAFSNNEFRWSARIKREDGLLRLVPGLGTRAVDRVGEDYPILVAPGQPGLRVNVTRDEAVRYSPRKMDVINLESGTFETVPIEWIFRECGREFPGLKQLVSQADADSIRQPLFIDHERDADSLVFTFEGLLRQTNFLSRMKTLLNTLREKMGTPVDLEFASDGKDLYLLQCRPQSFTEDASPSPIPLDIAPEKLIFSARNYVSNGRVPDITHIVYVDVEGYLHLPDPVAFKRVGRAVARLNKILPKRRFILIGPGRWGSRGDIKLGVSVTYSDINNSAMLIEVARKRGNYMPDLSFGTHFFQDLVEASIRYLPLFPDDEHVVFREDFLKKTPEEFRRLAPDFSDVAHVVHVVDVPKAADGLVLRVLANAEAGEAVAFLAPPQRPV
ncbi:MAG: PEP/pyruvate-binding domain-containing protein, partial [Acidobacteria bacterium]|nr:PEP/pyruvate-binding domain-containing protein [Acidobacteriota bacterium]